MAKPKQKLPKAFLACPFDKRMKKLVDVLNELPWIIKPANDRITSDHLLVKITSELEKCDFAIFDITGWNPNVCLELGLAKGMGINYYILNNNTVKKDVPSDIKGIERVDYNWNIKKKAVSLLDSLINGVFKKKFITSTIWRKIQHSYKAEEKFSLILKILSRFKGTKHKISVKEIKALAKGFNFRKQADYDEVINLLIDLKLFKKNRGTTDLTLIKKIY